MARFDLTPKARQDLQDIGDYIAAHDPAAALSMLSGFGDKFALLVQNPSLGRAVPEIALAARRVVHKNYIIYYRIEAFGVTIVRILHVRRDYYKAFGAG